MLKVAKSYLISFFHFPIVVSPRSPSSVRSWLITYLLSDQVAPAKCENCSTIHRDKWRRNNERSRALHNGVDLIYIDITAVLRAVYYIARVLACNILYLPEGASPRRRYFRIARRAPRARVLYDFTARMHEDDIVYIHQRAQRAGIALKTKYSPLVDIKELLLCNVIELNQ